MSRLRGVVLGIVLGLGLVALRLSPAVPADGSGGTKARRFLNARQGVGLEAPLGWSLSLHTGYANVLCVLVHPGGSRISLAVDRTTAGDASTLAAQSRPGLLAQGLTIDRVGPGLREGVLVESHSARREQVVRQLYLVRPVDGPRGERQGLVITLTTSPTDQQAAASAFDWVLAHLVLEAPVRTDDRPDAGR